jgi:hypothetical protein
LAREALDEWLRRQTRKARHNAIAAYAAECAGTSFDLDTDLETAGIEHLVDSGKPTQWSAVRFTGPNWYLDRDLSKPADAL